MATLMMELSSELSSLEAAIGQYGQQRTLQASELICIRSRVATATLKSWLAGPSASMKKCEANCTSS